MRYYRIPPLDRVKKPKYNNKKVIVDCEEYDSQKEAYRGEELRILECKGLISDLRRQVKFELIPSQKGEDGKVIERPCTYIADFVYTENGKTVVEDVKGFRTPEYKIKRKLMLWRYGLRVQEV